MKKVRSSLSSSKPQSTSEAPAVPPHLHPGDADTVELAGAAAPLPPEDPPPLFAVRSDAVLLLSEEEFANVDLTGRKRWTGIELTPEEAELVRTRVAHMEPEAATLVIVRLLKRKKPGEN